MTRYTNAGRKRTYVQASFDPNDDQTTTNAAASTPALDSRALDVSCASYESSVNAPPESNPKRRRKSKDNSGGNVAAESAPAVTVAGGENKKNSQATKTERERKKKLARLKAKEKAKRAKSACTFFYFLQWSAPNGGKDSYSAISQPLQTELRRVNRGG
jgi:zinc finger CCHC domain-containing protein 9